MSHTELNNFEAEIFLEQYWQKKPLLLEDAIPDFSCPLDADELAGLALEEDVESRIIVDQQHENGSDWKVMHGPFDAQAYQKLGRQNWTLLVQAVDLYVDEIADIKSYFSFIPDWRLDDVMISYAPTGGSVGPHFDQYDVFLLQASGQRRWKTGQFCDETTALQDNEQVKILSSFDTEQEYLLNPGDILYVPPGTAHWGVSESDDCMTLSIGFRAPSHSQILQNCCDEVVSHITDDQRFMDRNIDPESHSAKIPAHVEQQLKQLIEEKLLQSSALMNSFGQMMTDCKYPQHLVDDTLTLAKCKSEQLLLVKSPDARIAYFVRDEGIALFANGQSIDCDSDQEDFIQGLSDNCVDINHDAMSSKQQAVIDKLIKAGVYELYDEELDE